MPNKMQSLLKSRHGPLDIDTERKKRKPPSKTLQCDPKENKEKIKVDAHKNHTNIVFNISRMREINITNKVSHK